MLRDGASRLLSMRQGELRSAGTGTRLYANGAAAGSGTTMR